MQRPVRRDPKTLMRSGYNQRNSVKNVFVTGGAAMTSTSARNLLITHMALAARYVLSELKKKNL